MLLIIDLSQPYILLARYLKELCPRDWCHFLMRLVTAQQYGFLLNKSTTDATLRFTEHVHRTFHDGNSVLTTMLNFSKAFDTVQHSILLRKLDAMGVRGLGLQWFTSYLSDRKQFVFISGENSSLKSISSGVPQGSILGPLLFLAYINDMSRCSEELQFIHFADDTTVFVEGSCTDRLTADMNAGLAKIENWLSLNRLSLNIDKTVMMLLTNCDVQCGPVQIRGERVKVVRNTKFLGVIVDNRLTFANHVQSVCTKMSKSVGILFRLSRFLPSEVIRRLYLALVYPQMSYAVEVWGGSGKTCIDRVRRLQVRCLKLFVRRPLMFDEYGYSISRDGILSFNDLYKYFLAVKFFHYYVLQRSYFFNTMLANNLNIHRHNTRFASDDKLYHLPVRLSRTRCSFMFKGIEVWNKLPLELRRCRLLGHFKGGLKRWLYMPRAE